MLHLKKVAVTGGLSCGKSSVVRIFQELGAYVVSADTIVHQLLSSDADLGRDIVHLLGPTILRNKEIDRSQIARIVFHDQKMLGILENLLHPAVYAEIQRQYEKQLDSSSPPPLFIAEVPLLFESHGQPNFDQTIVVSANPTLCCTRFMKSTGSDESEYKCRMSHQMPLENKMKLADHVIFNNGTFDELKEQTRQVYHHLNIH